MGTSSCSSTSTPKLTSFAQYGLQTAFKEIERLHHEVTSAGNPISMDLKTRYVVKAIGKEQIISSKIQIHYDQATGKITKVQDMWNGQLPDSSFSDVSSIWQLLSPWWWLHYYEGWAWWLWSFTWYTWWWQVGGVLILPAASTPTRSLNIQIASKVPDDRTVADSLINRSFAR